MIELRPSKFTLASDQKGVPELDFHVATDGTVTVSANTGYSSMNAAQFEEFRDLVIRGGEELKRMQSKQEAVTT